MDYLYTNFAEAMYRPMGFGTLPVIVKNLMIVNGLVFLAQLYFEQQRSSWMDDMFALHDVHSVFFRPHQIVTHLFMHGDFMHILMNMFVLWIFGGMLEELWGPKRFLIFYMICGLGAAGLHLATLYFQSEPIMQQFRLLPLQTQEEYLYSPRFIVNVPTIGASGAVFGCLTAYGYLFPNNWFPLSIIPIKVKWAVIILIGGELWNGFRNSAGDNVAHWAHLGGALVGFLMVYYWNKTNRKRFY